MIPCGSFLFLNLWVEQNSRRNTVPTTSYSAHGLRIRPVKTIPGYTVNPGTQTQTVMVNHADTQAWSGCSKVKFRMSRFGAMRWLRLEFVVALQARRLTEEIPAIRICRCTRSREPPNSGLSKWYRLSSPWQGIFHAALQPPPQSLITLAPLRGLVLQPAIIPAAGDLQLPVCLFHSGCETICNLSPNTIRGITSRSWILSCFN